MEEKSRIINKLNNDLTRPVLFSESFGGSENQMRLLLNHLIVLNNVFSTEAATTLLLYKIQSNYWPALKSFLVFLNTITEDELPHIQEDEIVLDTLKEL